MQTKKRSPKAPKIFQGDRKRVANSALLRGLGTVLDFVPSND